MTITVASYLMGIPPGNTNPEKPAIIVNAIEGLRHAEDQSEISYSHNPEQCDVAVMQGWVYEQTNPVHLKLRKTSNGTSTKKRKTHSYC